MKNIFIPLIAAIFTFAFPLHMSAQVKTATMTGRVCNESGKGMQGVNIIVKSGNQTFGATSGRNGLYEIGFAKTDTITATFSYVGYGEHSATLPGDGHIKRDVTLRRMRYLFLTGQNVTPEIFRRSWDWIIRLLCAIRFTPYM